MKIGIVDYRMGNLASVSKSLERVGASPFVSNDSDELQNSDLVVLPGVGNFAAGMQNLRERDLDGFLKGWGSSGRPLVGICLGMQLLFEHSEEGDTPGLGILAGEVVRFDVDLKVPHMGWNRIWVEDSVSGGSGGPGGVLGPFDGDSFYFVHSYVCVPNGKTAATTDYGGEFAAAVEDGKIVGFQFHPEKSADRGLDLLERSLEVLE